MEFFIRMTDEFNVGDWITKVLNVSSVALDKFL